MSQPAVYVGIDVAHAELVVALRAPEDLLRPVPGVGKVLELGTLSRQ